MKSIILCVSFVLACVAGQRITTIQLDGVQYFVSRMNPYSPELNYFLAYQYCRSLGLQLASFETKEKVESMTQYLANAGYSKYNFWTSGNRLGTGMFLWMSTGLPFNATFDYFESTNMDASAGLDPLDHNSNTSPQRTARDSSSGLERACVHLKAPTLRWEPEDCLAVKDFICEQTRCYYYNYGSIPVSSAQGRPIITTSTTPAAFYQSASTARVQTTPTPVIHSSTTTATLPVEETSPLAALLSGNSINSGSESEGSLESRSDEEAVLDEEEEHDDEEHEVDEDDESEGRSQQEDESVGVEEHPQEEEEVVAQHDIPVEQKLKQITREIEEMSHSDRDVDNGRQSFLSLSDLIKNIRPAEKVIPQIDSSYSNTMHVLGETITHGESRSAKI
ncbi:uncharacterized protein LOC131684924 isoform X1 [Topomyia yanbarensis]|uniref:uncharacterized protein LOC131684924 isoform X1 n=2 Tax=Topomyia yanbarensis TaxID=2498891 RepID=UPI00273B0774|nr:uncharacterized protein LOC131684924 isoform X1 [Topomyia yanbarensis]